MHHDRLLLLIPICFCIVLSLLRFCLEAPDFRVHGLFWSQRGHLRQIELAGQVPAPTAFHGTGGQRDGQDR